MIQDLERRRNLEEQLRWDFMALDASGANRLSLKDGFLLFTMAHADEFCLEQWTDFLRSRGENELEEIYFDEIKVRLY